MIGLTRDLAQEWTGRKGIRVNALCPATSSRTHEHVRDLQAEMVATHTIMGRSGSRRSWTARCCSSPRRVVLVTGTTLVVDGGYTAI